MAGAKAATDVKRVVTGIDDEGKSVFVSDGPPPRSGTFELAGGLKQTDVWHLESPPKSPADGGDLDHYSNLVPPPGGAHWRVVEFPPVTAASSDVDTDDLIAELNEKIPDFLAYADLSRLGMHKTPTIDFGVVVSGEIWLELDDSEVHLKPGDCVVQRGTMHAWRNRSDKPCVMSFVLIAAGPKKTG